MAIKKTLWKGQLFSSRTPEGLDEYIKGGPPTGPLQRGLHNKKSFSKVIMLSQYSIPSLNSSYFLFTLFVIVLTIEKNRKEGMATHSKDFFLFCLFSRTFLFRVQENRNFFVLLFLWREFNARFAVEILSPFFPVRLGVFELRNYIFLFLVEPNCESKWKQKFLSFLSFLFDTFFNLRLKLKIIIII
jgi:hypothetical protein